MRESHRTSTTLLAGSLALFVAIGLMARPGAAQSPVSTKKTAAVQAESKDVAEAEQQTTPDSNQTPSDMEQAIQKIAASGQVLLIGETSSSRLNPVARLTPGAAPILTFRYLDGQARHRFGDLDLVMDDAGH